MKDTDNVINFKRPDRETESVLRLINSVEAADRLISWSIKHDFDGPLMVQYDQALEKAWERLLGAELRSDAARITRIEFLLEHLFKLSDNSNHARRLVRQISFDTEANSLGQLMDEHLQRSRAV